MRDLNSCEGFWEGQLTYLDYSTGKPYTMQANIRISFTQDHKGLIMGYEYPKEPHANAKDTTYVNGKLFGKESVVDFKKEPGGNFTLITERDGEDGNDHQKAILRHIYQLQANTFSVRKEVRFEGSMNWIKRNEYIFSRNKK